jgi:uncharacterized iron-regulated membrane protein
VTRPRLSWPTLPARFTADVLAGHSAVALALGGLIYLVCLTGTLCVFIDELQLWEAPSPGPSRFDPALSTRAIAGAIEAVGGPAKAPIVFLRAPVTPRERAVVSIGERRWAVRPDGRLAPLQLPWTAFLEALHYTLTLPAPWGELAVGGLGAALFSLLVSGVLAHPRILRDAFLLRLGGSVRLQEADLHNRLGVWGLPFHLAVTLSGALFGLAGLVAMALGAVGQGARAVPVQAAFLGPRVAADPRPAPLPPLGRAVAESLARTPGSQLFYLSVAAPGTRGAEATVEVSPPDRLPRGDVSDFDARGRRIGGAPFASGALGLQLYSGAAQVHFGFFGGLPVRLAYGVLGWALCWVCAGGTSIWLVRRRDRGRPAPRLEAAWAACVWGAPAALAVAALPLGWSPAATFWVGLVLLLAASQLGAGRTGRLAPDRLFRAVLAVALLACAIGRGAGATALVTPAVVEAAIVLAAVGLGLSAARREPVHAQDKN